MASWQMKLCRTFRRCTQAAYVGRARPAHKSFPAQALAEQKGLELAVPPPKLCTDNGVMVAWAGIERMRLGLWEHLPAHAAPNDEAEWVDVRPRWPLTDRYGHFNPPICPCLAAAMGALLAHRVVIGLSCSAPLHRQQRT